MPRPPLLLLCVALLTACAGGAQRQVQRGEELLAEGQARAALEAFSDAQRDKKLRGLDLTRAQVGEARAFLALGDLQNAKNRLRRLEETVSAKHYHLAEIALREGDRAAAAGCFQVAAERGHGGDTARRWAWVVASEATHPDQVVEAVRILERGGEAARAAALRELLGVWVDLLKGEPAAPLLQRLEGVEEALADHAVARVLRARLLDLLGRSIEADAAWDLGQATPVPSPDFRAHAAGLRSRLALEAGDQRGLEKALEGADLLTAARLRGELAWRRRQNGDLPRALELLRETAARGGAPAPLAAAQAAELAAAAGQEAVLEECLRVAEASPGGAAETDPELTLRRARQARAWRGDLLGAATLLEGVGDDDRGAAPLRQAASLLRAATQALGEGRPAAARRLARAARLLAPGDPAASALEAAAALGYGDPGSPGTSGKEQAALLRGASGATQLELDRLALRLLLAEGALGEVAQLLAASGKGSGAPAGAGLEPTLAAGIHAGLLAALRAGRGEACQAFLARKPVDERTLARLRASAALARLKDSALGSSRGPGALSRDPVEGGFGPGAGPRLPVGALGRAERGWSLTLPDGATLALPDDEALGAALGGPLGGLEWWPPAEGEAGLDRAARALRAPPWSAVQGAPVLEVP